MNFKYLSCILLLLAATVGCGASSTAKQRVNANRVEPVVVPPQTGATPRPSSGSPVLDKLVEAAIERTTFVVRYDPAYMNLDYPGGDVPPEIGVCTDEVVRSYRKLGIDLQKEVHEDMKSNFGLYPRKWGLKRTDTNIDHRRVPNLMVFFTRKGESLPVTNDERDYRPGDIVTWELNGGLPHIGIMVNVATADSPDRFMLVHNIGAGPQMEDALFSWKITGHYRYLGPPAAPESK